MPILSSGQVSTGKADSLGNWMSNYSRAPLKLNHVPGR